MNLSLVDSPASRCNDSDYGEEPDHSQADKKDFINPELIPSSHVHFDKELKIHLIVSSPPVYQGVAIGPGSCSGSSSLVLYS